MLLSEPQGLIADAIVAGVIPGHSLRADIRRMTDYLQLLFILQLSYYCLAAYINLISILNV